MAAPLSMRIVGAGAVLAQGGRKQMSAQALGIVLLLAGWSLPPAAFAQSEARGALDVVWTVRSPQRTARFLESAGFRREGAWFLATGSRVRLERGAAPAPLSRPAALRLVEDPASSARALGRRGLKVRRLQGQVPAFEVRSSSGWRVVLRRPADQLTVECPLPGALRPFVLEVIAGYPTDGTHRYHWPRSGGWKGNTKDLRYAGSLLCAGDPKGRAYCCGLTFEVFFEAWRLWCAHRGRPFRIARMDRAAVRRLQGQWFGSAADRSCLRTALVEGGLGTRLDEARWHEARPGDFLQLWRNSGSGHSVVFLAWVRKGGRIVGIRYWSTQKSTRGIGEREERFGSGRQALKRDEFYLCRVGVKR